MIDRERLAALLGRERDSFAERHPRSRAAYAAAGANLLGNVPMTWMNKAAGRFPVYLAEARGAAVVDLDGHRYVDLCLGDTAAMAGHSPEATVAAVGRRYAEAGGATAMLPTEDAAWVGAELARRFGVPLWSFSLTATDANRWAIRLARLVTGRPKILVFNWCYHGTVDESFVTLGPDGAASREGNVGPPVDPAATTRVVEFNDLDALDRELANGDVACVLMEPALTNIGIVLPVPGYLEGVRELTRRHGSLLVNDETHTLSAGPGGCTLAGNALSVAAMRATLEHALTDHAFEHMIGLGTRFTAGVQGVLDACQMPWSVVQLGARAEYRFTSPAPVNGGQSAAAGDDQLDDYLHLYLHNRGILLTPFHNMALMCPATTEADVDRHTEVFGAAVAELAGDRG